MSYITARPTNCRVKSTARSRPWRKPWRRRAKAGAIGDGERSGHDLVYDVEGHEGEDDYGIWIEVPPGGKVKVRDQIVVALLARRPSASWTRARRRHRPTRRFRRRTAPAVPSGASRESMRACAVATPRSCVEPPRRGRALAADAQPTMVRRRRRRCAAVDRLALRRLRLLAPSRRRTEPRQPGRHADGLVDACRKLRPSRATPDLRTWSARILAGDAGHGLLRRWRGAGARAHIGARTRHGAN